MSVIGDVPLFWPATALALVFAAGLAGPVGRLLRTPGWSAWLLLSSLGVIFAATLTPSIAAFIPLGRPPGCLLGLFKLPPLSALVYPNETSLNVAMFVPLGVACALLRRWSQVFCFSVLAFGLPFVLEFAQYVVPRLGRVCSTADVADNLLGLGVGLVVGIVGLRPIGSVMFIDAVARGPR